MILLAFSGYKNLMAKYLHNDFEIFGTDMKACDLASLFKDSKDVYISASYFMLRSRFRTNKDGIVFNTRYLLSFDQSEVAQALGQSITDYLLNNSVFKTLNEDFFFGYKSVSLSVCDETRLVLEEVKRIRDGQA